MKNVLESVQNPFPSKKGLQSELLIHDKTVNAINICIPNRAKKLCINEPCVTDTIKVVILLLERQNLSPICPFASYALKILMFH
ncbi:hypothetical protein V1478_014909 [Vespula squamosa]|uniref:Uncharacterized protein n=1 Tax=Vespula squamosa TaxID=30214 RepID=A0ABD2A3M8_VESSQ